MRTVTATELRAKLGEILDAASAGERILIERDHRPLAFLMSFEDGRLLDGSNEDRRKRRLEALDRIQSFAAEMQAKGSRDPKAPDAVTAVRLDRDRDEPGRSES
jgi:prevent-host-death family protein